MPNPLVTFCIATYNRGPVLLDCLRKTLANALPARGEGGQFEIRIIDNASTDDTPALLAAAKLPNTHVIRLRHNRGPVAKNLAIRQALNAGSEFLVLLDDDAYPHPGAIPQMLRHFKDDPHLGAAVFDVTLPDGSREGSAYPDAFIGAGTGLRSAAVQKAGGGLPTHFFMQAEEYDLSFRLIDAGFSVQRFWDLPLTHLKTPNARIGQRTTRLDVRNNLFLLAKYLPDPLCHQFAADWLARYFLMAQQRDRTSPAHPDHGSHKQAFLKGAAEGLAQWSRERAGGQHLLQSATIEQIFKFQTIHRRLATLVQRTGAKRILFAEFGKNLLPFHRAARQLNLDLLAVMDDALAPPPGLPPADYRGIPLLPWAAAPKDADLVLLTNISPVHAPARAAALRRTLDLPVVDLFSRQDHLLHPASFPRPALVP